MKDNNVSLGEKRKVSEKSAEAKFKGYARGNWRKNVMNSQKVEFITF